MDNSIHTRCRKMWLLLPMCILILVGGSGCKGSHQEEYALKANRELLQHLDSLIASHDRIIEAKELQLQQMRREYTKAAVDSGKVALARKLYHEYMVYDPDSAMYYADEASRLTAMVYPHDADRRAVCVLDKIFINATQGFSQEALERLATVNPSDLSKDTKIYYYQTAQYLYSSRALFNNPDDFNADPWMTMANVFRDSLVQLDPDRRMDALWIPIAMNVDKDNEDYSVPSNTVKKLEKAVESSNEASRINAINAYWLARHYKKTDNEEKMVRYMTKAAIYDAEIENREIAAITELASWLFDQGDLDRAYTYLIYSSDQASSYSNRARVINVGSVLPMVRDAYREAILQRDRRLHSYVLILIGLSLVLLGAGVFIVLENRRLTRTRRELAESHSELKSTLASRDEAIGALEQANGALREANLVLNEADKVKQGLVTLSFRLASDHINALDEYRKKLLRKFKLKQYVELGAELNDQELVRDPYRNLYAAFDHTVLSIFPEFVTEYNSSSLPEAHVDPEQILKSRTLNTRMRIFALRKLGVKKSGDIASMLGVSVRTVYNNKS